jgi:hypothetical protein
VKGGCAAATMNTQNAHAAHTLTLADSPPNARSRASPYDRFLAARLRLQARLAAAPLVREHATTSAANDSCSASLVGRKLVGVQQRRNIAGGTGEQSSS